MPTCLRDLCTAKPIDPLQIRTITAAVLPFSLPFFKNGSVDTSVYAEINVVYSWQDVIRWLFHSVLAEMREREYDRIEKFWGAKQQTQRLSSLNVSLAHTCIPLSFDRCTVQTEQQSGYCLFIVNRCVQDGCIISENCSIDIVSLAQAYLHCAFVCIIYSPLKTFLYVLLVEVNNAHLYVSKCVCWLGVGTGVTRAHTYQSPPHELTFKNQRKTHYYNINLL